METTKRFLAAFSRFGLRAGRLVAARPYLAASMIILGFGMVGGYVGYVASRPMPTTSFGDGPAPSAINAAVLDILSDDRCHPAEEAEAAIRARLDELGYVAWTVSRGTGVHDGGCVTLSVEPANNRVVLLMSLDPAVRKGLAAVADRLLHECHHEDDAANMVRAVLALSDDANWELRTGGGLVGPNDMTVDEVKRHVEAGCWIYSGTGWTAEGVRLYWIGGK